jgi:hypothetical protein
MLHIEVIAVFEVDIVLAFQANDVAAFEIVIAVMMLFVIIVSYNLLHNLD